MAMRALSLHEGRKMSVEFLVDDKVAVVTLAKPPHNLIDNDLIEGMRTAYKRAVQEGMPRHLVAQRDATLLRRCGRFCLHTGGNRTTQEEFAAIMDELENVGIPTVAAVHGAALGGGVELSLDLRPHHRG